LLNFAYKKITIEFTEFPQNHNFMTVYIVKTRLSAMVLCVEYLGFPNNEFSKKTNVERKRCADVRENDNFHTTTALKALLWLKRL